MEFQLQAFKMSRSVFVIGVVVMAISLLARLDLHLGDHRALVWWVDPDHHC